MLGSPLATLTGWTWEPQPRSFAIGDGIPGGTFVGLRGRGPATRLRSPITATITHVASGSTHAFVGSPADVLSLGASARALLRFGNVEVIVSFTASGVPAAAFEAGELRRGADIATVDVTEVAVALRYPGHPAIDSLAILRELATVVGDVSLQTWADAFGTADGALRVVSPSGRPFAEQMLFTLGTRDFIIEPAHAGDILAAAAITRSELGAGTVLRWRRGGEATAIQLATPDGAFGVDEITISSTTPYVTASHSDLWFADQQATGLARTTRGNRVTPFINGPEFFEDIFTELHAISATTPPALYLTGYAINHDAILGPTSVTNRTLLELVRAIEAAGGESRFLALDFLQIDPETVFDYQTAPVVLVLLFAIGGMATAVAGNAEEYERFNAFGVAATLAVGGVALTTLLQDIIEGREPNARAVEALTTGTSVAVFDPYPSVLGDNWRGDISNVPLSLVADVIHNVGVFHQKIAIVRNDLGLHAYCGGIDLNPDRIDTREHGSRAPFHDVHARIDGPAVAELAQTFMQRWQRERTEPLSLAAAGTFDALPTPGHDIVQVARTYYRPPPGGTGLPFAPSGESTILETTLRAIAQARHYIYIEDQYLTPPERYIAALEAAAARDVGSLIIVVPDHPDQPFGLGPRQRFANRMRAAWGERLRIGNMRNPFARLNATRIASLGRLWLREELTTTASKVTVGPTARVPKPPFWLAIDREVMWVPATGSPRDAMGHDDGGRAVTLEVERGRETNLYGIGIGTEPARHEAGAAATVIHYPGIYVHSKVTLIDDCFASLGSANINRRGFFSDGECTLFTLREELAHGDNWIRALRKRLWGELLGVPEAFALAMFDDPLAHLELFDRPVYTGNRFVPFDSHPFGIDFGGLSAAFTTESGVLDIMISAAGVLASVALAATDTEAVFDTIIDPTSELEPRS